MTYDDAVRFLDANGQAHVLRFWSTLTDSERERLLNQIAGLDAAQISRMRGMLTASSAAAGPIGDIAPAPVLDAGEAHTPEAIRAGEDALRRGSVGVILVAGGQGSRLGYEGPKGCFPIGPITKASLFSIHSRKILALERQYGAHIPFYVMTSVANDAETKAFFARNDYFGLHRDRVRFFMQGMWPALDQNGRLVMETTSSLFMSPDGHGGILSAMKANGVFADLEARKIETLYYFQVDNPLVDIAAPGFLGLHLLRQAEMSLKVCAKRGPEEGLGVVVQRGGRFAMVEYTELTTQQKHARVDNGDLLFKYGSVAIHVFSVAFLQQQMKSELPLHLAHKKVPYCDESGIQIKPEKPNAYKFEKFIFDVLLGADRVVNLAFAREDEFSPVKNATGSDSPETTRHDLVAKYTRWLNACGVTVPLEADGRQTIQIEIDPCYALNAGQLKQRLRPDFKVTKDLLLT